MKLILALVLAAGCGAPKGNPIEATTVPTNELPPEPSATDDPPLTGGWRSGPGGFPVPPDATEAGETPNGGVGYVLTRTKDAAFPELKAKLEELGYRIETYMPSETSHRLVVYNKTGQKFIASVSDHDDVSTLFITVH